MKIAFNKNIQTKIQQEVFYHEGEVEIDNVDYFINKIEEGIINSSNNNLTYVKGFMTPWKYFIEDEKFLILFLNIINKLEEQDNNFAFSSRWKLEECWGIKEVQGGSTTKHTHKECAFSGIIYLNDVDHPLIFDEISINLVPKKGRFAVFSGDLTHYTRRNLTGTNKYALVFNSYFKKDW